jgi:hypothetical protein
LSKQPRESEQKRDWRISATLAAVWIVALIIINGSSIDIPASMLVIATVFFVLLIPAMNDLVQSIERLSARTTGVSETKHNSGGNHE